MCHAEERLQERYGVEPEDCMDLLCRIAQMIQHGGPNVSCTMIGRGGRSHWTVWISGTPLGVIYDEWSKRVVTVLPIKHPRRLGAKITARRQMRAPVSLPKSRRVEDAESESALNEWLRTGSCELDETV